jgi:hypothetical protein
MRMHPRLRLSRRLEDEPRRRFVVGLRERWCVLVGRAKGLVSRPIDARRM